MKKSSTEFIENFFIELSKLAPGEFISISSISSKINSSPSTTKSWVDIIEMIQKKPCLMITRINSNRIILRIENQNEGNKNGSKK